MTETNLRKANATIGHIEDSLPEDSSGQITVKEVSSITADPVVDQYPFSGQQIIQGTISYVEPSTYTDGRTVSINFELRTDSSLFLTDVATDSISIESAISEFMQATGESISIYRNLHAAEDALWEFLMTADRVLEITVLDHGEEVGYTEIEGIDVDDVIGEFAIENASVGFVEDGNEIFVEYRGGSLQIETDWPDGREFIIQTFEKEVLSG